VRRDVVWSFLALAMSVHLATSAVAYGASSDDDLLGNIGQGPKTQPAPAPSSSPAAPPAGAPPPAAPPAAPKPVPAASEPAVDTSNPDIFDRIKAVPRKALLKRHRLELTPMFGLSLNDPYFQHLSMSGALVFYLHDAFGIGVGVDYLYLHARTSAIDDVRQSLTSVLGTFNMPKLFAHVDMYWVPIYGKVSLFDSGIVNFDLYASAGAGVATALGTVNPPEINVAIGQHYVIEQWLALRFEVRDHVFVDTQRANNTPRSSVQSYVMFMAGLSFYIPPTFEYTFQ
jgi:outer membrane beta-barrel protein